MSDWQVLVLVIVAPLVLSLFSCALIGRQSGREKLSGYGLPSLSQYLVNLFRVDARALHSQPLLWGALLTPLFYSVAITLPFIAERELDMSPEGIAVFFELAKIGIYILSVSLPLGLLVARMHSTVQVEEQIKANHSNATFGNYFTHRKLVRKEVEEICLRRKMELAAGPDFYKVLFPNNSPFRFLETEFPARVVRLIENARARSQNFFNVFDVEMPNGNVLTKEISESFVDEVLNIYSDSWFRPVELKDVMKSPRWDRMSPGEKKTAWLTRFKPIGGCLL